MLFTYSYANNVTFITRQNINEYKTCYHRKSSLLRDFYENKDSF